MKNPKFPWFLSACRVFLGACVVAGLSTAYAASTVPGAPISVSATGSNSTVSVAFTAPSSNGGSTITSYTVTCKATGQSSKTAKGSSSPLSVSGLTNGTSYSCSVTATNAIGTGSASSALAVTPATVPGTPTIGVATGSSSSASVAFKAPSSNGGSSITGYTATCTATGQTTRTGTGTSSPLAVSSLTNGASYSCSVTATNAKGAGAASSSVSVTPTLISTPSNFETLVAKTYTPSATLTATTTLTNRERYMISDLATASTSANYLSIGSAYSSAGYSVTSGTLTTNSTYKDYLNKTIQVTLDSSDTTGTYYRFDSHLHPNNSLDVSSSTNYSSMKFKNNFGKATLTSGNYPGYVTFSYDSTTGKFKARKRYVYAYTCSSSGTTTSCPSSYTSTTYSSNLYLTYSGGAYSLTKTGTHFYLYATPLSLGIPSFMNPKSVDFVTNSAYNFLTGKATVSSIEGTYTTSGAGSTNSCSTGSIYTSLNSTYKPQACYPGTNTTTRAAAVTQLATIKSAVEANGESLRYSTDVYLAFRDALLAQKLVSDSIADGTPGQNMVPFVYFTNESDGSKYHPMMVIVSYGNQTSPNGLKDVPKPPGASSDNCSSYSCSPVTRYANLENYVLAIPMKDYGVISTLTDNSLTTSLCSDDSTCSASTSNRTVYNYADTADNGILVNGAVMFPLYNNALYPSPIAGELSASGCHVGQGGGGPHCHSDGYLSGQGLGLYNDTDYTSKVTHPPLIGFGYDGVALFGQYRATTDASLLGYSTSLGDWGVHNHDSIGNHYHSHTITWSGSIPGTDGTVSVSNIAVLMKGAYIGKIANIPYFRSSCGSKFQVNKYLGGTTSSVSC